MALVFDTSDREKQRKTIKTRMNFDTLLKICSWVKAQKLNSGLLQGAIEDRNHGYSPLELETSAILACLHLMRLDKQLTSRMLYLNATEIFFLLVPHCLVGYGTFTLKMDFYESSSFTTPYTAQDYPQQWTSMNMFIYNTVWRPQLTWSSWLKTVRLLKTLAFILGHNIPFFKTG